MPVENLQRQMIDTNRAEYFNIPDNKGLYNVFLVNKTLEIMDFYSKLEHKT